MSKERSVIVDGLTRKFGDFVAVDHISFEIPKGEIFGLLGPNGAGKTTTIRMLCGILKPTSGHASIMGFDTGRQVDRVKNVIGYMSQKFSLYNDLTVQENLNFYSNLYNLSGKEANLRIAELIDLVGLKTLTRFKTYELSGAWRQKLALACSIVHQPPMLFLDEPTAGVDPISRREFWELIYSLAGTGVTVLTTTHYMDEAEFCNLIGMMYSSRMIAMNDPDTLRNEISGVLYDIDCQNPILAKTLLTDFPLVKRVTTHGVILHVNLNADRDIDKVKDVLKNNNIGVKQIEKIIPSLEDVFVHLVEREKTKLNQNQEFQYEA